ncbi:hypothetical protein Q73_12520 [Bacillus coahuilensis m2-6]|nr:hypothetical protein Q73_12520 [Bacillus coahuilensis m2-6]
MGHAKALARAKATKIEEKETRANANEARTRDSRCLPLKCQSTIKFHSLALQSRPSKIPHFSPIPSESKKETPPIGDASTSILLISYQYHDE